MFLRGLREERNRSTLPPVVAVVGTEAYLRLHTLQGVQELLEREHGTVTRTDLEGDATDPPRFVENVSGRLLSGDWQFVVLDNTAGKQVWLETKERRDVLETVLRRPPDGTCLAIVARTMPRTTKVAALVDERGLRVDCDPLPQDVLRDWLMRQARGFELTMTADTAEAFIRYVGPDMNQLASELEKIDIYLGAQRQITPTVLRDVATFNGTAKTWDLLEHLGRRDARRALEALSILLAHGHNAYEIVGLLAWRLRQHWQAAGQLADGASMQHAIRMAGVPPFAADQFRRAQVSMSLDRCRWLHDLLLRVDRKADDLEIGQKLWFFVIQATDNPRKPQAG